MDGSVSDRYENQNKSFRHHHHSMNIYYVMLVFMSWWLLSQNPVCNSPPAFRLLMRRGDCSVLNGFMDERLARDTDGGLKVCIWPSNNLTRSKRSIRTWRRLFWPVILMLYLFIMEEIGRYGTKNMENLKYKYFLCTKMISGISLPSKAMIDREHLRKQPYWASTWKFH